jgi:toxin HigB-1
MIRSFGDPGTEDLYHGRRTGRVRRFPPDIMDAALRKLDALESAVTLGDLQAAPGNRLEALAGNLKGCFSIRINRQWRVVFQWDGRDARDVRIVDYH